MKHDRRVVSGVLGLLVTFAAFASCSIELPLIRLRFPVTAPTVSVPVDADGGEVVLTRKDGTGLASLTVPDGALTEPVTLSITESPSEYEQISSVFTLEPTGQTFERPVVLSISCDNLIAATKVEPSALCLYILSDQGFLSPIYSSRYDPDLGALTTPIIHFSEGFGGPRPNQLSSLDIQAIKDALGIEISAEYLAQLNEVFDLYVAAIYNPWLDTSLLAGVGAVEAWCNAQSDLEFGAEWVDDCYVVGWDMAVVACKADYTSDPVGQGYFTYIGFSARGDSVRPDDERYLQMVCQSHYVLDTQMGIESVQIFDIDIKRTMSNLQLIAQIDNDTGLGQGATATITGTLWCPYQAYGASWIERGIANETITLETDGAGSFVADTVQTAEDGTFTATYVADWETSEAEPEVANITVRYSRGSLTLSEQFMVTETQTELIDSTSPSNGAVNVPVDSAIEIVFSEAMVTESVDAALTVTPGIQYSSVWDLGQTRITLMPDTELEPGESYMVTLSGVASGQSGTQLVDAYSFSFTTVHDGPVVVAISPTEDATDVPVTTTVSVTFSASMDTASTEAAFRLTSPSLEALTAIWSLDSWPGTFGWDDTATCLSVIPGMALEQDEVYTVWVDETAQDTSGAFLAAWNSDFTTELKEDTEPPEITDLRLSLANTSGTQEIAVTFEPATDNLTQQWFLEYQIVYSLGNNVYSVPMVEANGIALTSWTEAIVYMASGMVGSTVQLTSSDLVSINVVVRDSAGNKSVYTSAPCRLLGISQWIYTDLSRETLVENLSYMLNMEGEVAYSAFGWEPYGTYTYENGRLTINGVNDDGQVLYETHPFLAYWAYPATGDTMGTYESLEKVSGEVESWPGMYRRESRKDFGPESSYDGRIGTRIRELTLHPDGTLTDYNYTECPYDPDGPYEQTLSGVWSELSQGIEISYVRESDGELYYTRTVFDYYFTVADTYYFYIRDASLHL